MKAVLSNHLPKATGAVLSLQGLLLVALALAAYPLGHSCFPTIGPAKQLAIATGLALLLFGVLISRASSLPEWVEYLPTIWHTYWFRPGGKYSLAIVRMAVAASLLQSAMLRTDYKAFLEVQSHDLYRPQGILNLLSQSVLPSSFFEAAQVVALVSTWFAFFGLFTRISMFASSFSCLILSSLDWSFTPCWCHSENVELLAQLALLFGPSGKALSADALITSWLRKPPRDTTPDDLYRWPVLLAQFAVALMFFNAAWYKLRSDGYHVGWALSDNLRHQLVLQYYFMLGDPTPIPEWIMTNEWRWRAAALGNLISQSMPILACVFVRRPLLRAFFGSFFILETLGLGMLMGLWDNHWFPLYTVFVDWDRLIRWFASRLRVLLRVFCAPSAKIWEWSYATSCSSCGKAL